MSKTYIVELRFNRNFLARTSLFKKRCVVLLDESKLVGYINQLFYCDLVKSFNICGCFSDPNELENLGQELKQT